MKLFGLTGGVGMGKSVSASLLAKRGVPVIDTDDIAREIVRPGEPALKEICGVFGSEVIDEAGLLRRSVLAEIVFASPEKRRQLEAILHPRIRAQWLARAEGWRQENKPVGVVVIPLLFETGAESNFDSVVCTACSAASQRERLRARGWSEEQTQQRITAQWPIENKIAAAHFVIWTEGTFDVHERQLERVFWDYLGLIR